MTKANFLIKNELQLFTKEPELVNQIVKKDRKKADLSRVWKIVEQFEVRFYPELKSCENWCLWVYPISLCNSGRVGLYWNSEQIARGGCYIDFAVI